MKNLSKFLANYDAVFWDFDGVIKDSVSVKEDAFVEVFQPVSCEQEYAIREHHRNNGGMSRYEKIPIYAQIVGWKDIDEAYHRAVFAEKCISRVIESDWIVGVRDILNGQKACLWTVVSATPEEEIKHIISEIGLSSIFDDVRGSPTSKIKNGEQIIADADLPNDPKLVVLGDAHCDLEMAQFLGADFIYVSKTPDPKIEINSILTIGDFGD